MISIDIDKLYFSYKDKKVLDGISINFEKGKFYSIIGPNGCGKTTILKNISRLLEPSKNTVFIDKNDIINLNYSFISKKISTVPQKIYIDYEFTVYDIVMMGRIPHKKKI